MVVFIAIGSAPLRAQQSERPVRRDIAYATVGDRELLLDIYLPRGADHPPLVVWVHGGAWRSGSKADAPLEFVAHGFALASIDYRLSPEARFPAQIHDIKASIRFLRANAAKYGYSAERLAIAGSSAGGHLAALVGVTNGHQELEGTLGEHRNESSDVQAIVDYYGPTNFATILKQSTQHGLGVRVPALQLLLGDQPENAVELARLASPVAHVDAEDPPLLLVHGDQDPQVPINQSHELAGAYKQMGVPVRFEVVYGGAHGGEQFFDGQRMDLVEAFIRHSLAGDDPQRAP